VEFARIWLAVRSFTHKTRWIMKKDPAGNVCLLKLVLLWGISNKDKTAAGNILEWEKVKLI
jgi:hypothetical protein